METRTIEFSTCDLIRMQAGLRMRKLALEERTLTNQIYAEIKATEELIMFIELELKDVTTIPEEMRPA